METLVDVVCGVEVTSKHSLKVLANQCFDHLPPTRMMILILANAGSGDAPDVAIGAIFSPSRLIGLHRWTGADLPFERIELGLHLVFQTMQQLDDFSTADRHLMDRLQVALDLPNGQAHHRWKGGDQTAQPDAYASLSKHLIVQIHWRFVPFLTPGTPPFVDAVFGDLYWRRGWHIDDFSLTRSTDPSQRQMTVWARHDPALPELGRHG